MNHSPQVKFLEDLRKFKTIGRHEGNHMFCYYRIPSNDLNNLEKSAQLLLLQARTAVEMLETADPTCQVLAPALAQAAEHFEYLIDRIL